MLTERLTITLTQKAGSAPSSRKRRTLSRNHAWESLRTRSAPVLTMDTLVDVRRQNASKDLRLPFPKGFKGRLARLG